MKKLKMVQLVKEGSEYLVQGVYRNVNRSLLSTKPEIEIGLLDKGKFYLEMREEAKKLAFHNNVEWFDLAGETVEEVLAKMEKRA